jgi:hypothetical protein
VYKKLNRFEIALNFAKQLLVSSFFIYIASFSSLGTLDTRIMKKILEHKFCEPGGGGCLFQQTKNACARNLKALIDGKFVGFLITVQNFRQFALV